MPRRRRVLLMFEGERGRRHGAGSGTVAGGRAVDSIQIGRRSRGFAAAAVVVQGGVLLLLLWRGGVRRVRRRRGRGGGGGVVGVGRWIAATIHLEALRSGIRPVAAVYLRMLGVVRVRVGVGVRLRGMRMRVRVRVRVWMGRVL